MLRQISRAVALVAALALSSSPARAGYDVYVSELDGRGSGQVLKVAASGQTTVFAAQGLNSPTGLAFDTQGNLLVADTQAGNIHKFSAAGADLGVFAAANLTQPYGLTFAGDGSLYVSANNDIVRLAGTTGAEIGRFSGGSTPTQIAFTPSGLLDVVALNGGEVRQYDPDGTSRGVLISGLQVPFGLAIAATGDLYISELFTNQIRHFSATGQDLGVFASTGLINPSGLAFDGDGNLYVVNGANGANGYVSKFSSTGANLGIVASGLSGTTFLALRPDAVPEPGSFALAIVGLMPLLLARSGQARRPSGAAA